ncbi:MAG: cytochrome C biogenesis protein [Chlorobium sp.]|nr:cytochrome C biogenesis protein [Chlorobium sp.]
MFESLSSTLTSALGYSFFFALLASFVWGMLSVMHSPCHLSGIPLVIGYISSNGRVKVKRTVSLSLYFAAGSLFSVAGVGLIIASMGTMLGDTEEWGTVLLAVLFILVGLYLMDLIQFHWKGIVMSDEQRGGLWGAFFLGLIFGIGHGPCTFAFLAPVLGAAFKIASTNWLQAVLLIGAFGVGHAVVIAIAGSMTSLVQKYIDWAGKSQAIVYLKRCSGFVLLFAGFYFLYTVLF